MKTALKVIGATFAVLALGIFALLYFTSGARDVARSFVLSVSSGEYDTAHALLHDGLKETHTVESMRATFGGSAPYEKVRFNSVSATAGSATEVMGTATTASGCSTQVAFEILDGRIIGFEMRPLCPG